MLVLMQHGYLVLQSGDSGGEFGLCQLHLGHLVHHLLLEDQGGILKKKYQMTCNQSTFFFQRQRN